MLLQYNLISFVVARSILLTTRSYKTTDIPNIKIVSIQPSQWNVIFNIELNTVHSWDKTVFIYINWISDQQTFIFIVCRNWETLFFVLSVYG